MHCFNYIYRYHKRVLYTDFIEQFRGSRPKPPCSRAYGQGSKVMHYWGPFFRARRSHHPASGSLTSHVIGLATRCSS